MGQREIRVPLQGVLEQLDRTADVVGHVCALEQNTSAGVIRESLGVRRRRSGEPLAVGPGQRELEGLAQVLGGLPVEDEGIIDASLVLPAPRHGVIRPHEVQRDADAAVRALDAAVDEVGGAQVTGHRAGGAPALLQGGRARDDRDRRKSGEMGDEAVAHSHAEIFVGGILADVVEGKDGDHRAGRGRREAPQPHGGQGEHARRRRHDAARPRRAHELQGPRTMAERRGRARRQPGGGIAERRLQVGGGGKPPFGLALQTAQDDRVERRGDVGHQAARGRAALVRLAQGERDAALVPRRTPAREHLEQDEADAVEVGAVVGGTAPGLLG